jgi:GNAT superfamily N-acetyltransferase
MAAPDIRLLRADERAAWEPLWLGYQTFYKVALPAEATDAAWARFHDPSEPMEALGAFVDRRLVGIAHMILHRSTWTVGPYCYLQDLFTVPEARGQGIASALVSAVVERARAAGASRVHWLTHESNATARALYDRIADRSGFLQYRIVI